MGSPKPFADRIFVTRPLLPPLQDVIRRLREVWAAQWLTNGGAQLQLLEERLRAYLKTSELLLFNNGTTALMAGLRALELHDEVITTPFTFAATTHSLAWAGLCPVFCDIAPDTMCLDAQRIEPLITRRTSAILAVHVYGNLCDVRRIQAIAERHDLKVIYDAAHAFGCELDGRGVGAFGDITMYSFHATKLFHTAEGGALAFRDPALRARIALLRNFGIENENEVSLPGLNGKMNELQAALGLAVLDYVEDERRRRAAVFATYQEQLGGLDGLTTPTLPPEQRPSYQYFVVRIDPERFGKDRDEVYARLKQFNVYARKYFHPLVSEYACYRDLTTRNADHLPVARRVASQVLSLPCYGALGADRAQGIAEILRFIHEH